MGYYRLLPGLTILLFLFGCKGNSQTEASSENPGTVELTEIEKEAEEIYGLRSLLITKNGELVSESYFENYPKDSLDHVRSVTKSVMGLLIGIAIDQQVIESIHDPIDKYLTGVNGLEERHKEIKLRDILTMSGGFQWDESTVSEFNNWVTSSDPVAYVLKRKLVAKAGEKFEYNSASSHLLSVILSRASGLSTFEFAQRYLFQPLQIKGVRWSKINGYYNGGAGLELKPKDMMLIGKLVAGEGTYRQKEIVSRAWIQEMIEPHMMDKASHGYGYQWWRETDAPMRNALALGYGGQFIIVFPDSDAVIVATSNWRGRGASTQSERSDEFFALLRSKVFPFLKQ